MKWIYLAVFILEGVAALFSAMDDEVAWTILNISGAALMYYQADKEFSKKKL